MSLWATCMRQRHFKFNVLGAVGVLVVGWTVGEYEL